VLTSALGILEVQFEGAEKENKKLRAANRSAMSLSHSEISALGSTSSFSTSSSAASVASSSAAAMLQLVRLWRGVAMHRLMSSLKPLPVVVSPPVALPLSTLPTAASALNPPHLSFSDPEVADAHKTALSTYRY
jgi:hypothetical protein